MAILLTLPDFRHKGVSSAGQVPASATGLPLLRKNQPEESAGRPDIQ